MIPASPSAKVLADMQTHDAWGKDHGVVPGSAADQAVPLDFVLDNMVMPAGGRDWGPLHIPAGKLRLASTWDIFRARAARIEGAGWTRNNLGPRNHGGVTNMSGTDLYWGGGAGGTMIKVTETSFLELAHFALYLDETAGGPQAAIGIHWINDQTFGHGRNTIRNLALTALAHGGTGMQFGNHVADANVDTFHAERCQFYDLATACRFKHDQALEWTFVGPVFTNVDTWFHFESGGNLHVVGFQAQEARANQNIVLVKVDKGGVNSAMFTLFGGYIDRAGADTKVTLFEPAATVNHATFAAYSVHVRQMTGTAIYDGTARAFVEACGGHQYSLENCRLLSQPIVRWRTSATGIADPSGRHRRGVVRMTGGMVDGARKFGTELVTVNEGGYAGQAFFDNVLCTGGVTLGMDHQTVSVNHFPVLGNKRTHWDIDNFDATDIPSQLGSDQPSAAVLDSAWLTSWLGGGHTDSPAWKMNLHAYYSMSERLTATSLVDRVNHQSAPASDLTIDSDMQVASPAPPLPYLEQWTDWTLSNADEGRDTGVPVNPLADDLTVFGFFELQTRTVGAEVFTLKASSGQDYRILSVADTVGTIRCLRANASGQHELKNITQLRAFTPVFAVVCLSATFDRIEAYINGVQVISALTAGYTTAGAGTIWIGGRPGSGRFSGRTSRCGIVKQFLTPKEATVLSLAASVCAERRQRNPL
jgi:hypothetical protein